MFSGKSRNRRAARLNKTTEFLKAFLDSPIKSIGGRVWARRTVPICLMGTAIPFFRKTGEERAYLDFVCPGRPARNDG
jgi:hypothetical protein